MDVAELALKVDSKDVLTANQRMGGLNRTASKSPGLIKAFAGAVASVGLVTLARDAIKTYSEFETLNASLKTVTGSADLAAVAMSQIEEFASTTPFSLQQATQGFIKLKSLGLDPSAEAMRSYGNTAAAMGKELNQAVEAVADATTGEFERLKEFGIRSKTVGDNVEFTFQGVTTTVKKNATEIEGYFRSIGDVNFAGAMTDQMDTIKGATSNLSDNFEKLQRNFVEATGLGDLYKETLLGISGAIGDIDFDVISAELSTWSEFGDDISDVYDEFKKLIGQFADFDDVIDQSGLTIKDYFLDFPVWAKAAFDKIIAHGIYGTEYIRVQLKNLQLRAGDIWDRIAGKFKVAFYGMKEVAAKISLEIGNSFAGLLGDFEKGARGAGFTKIADSLQAQAKSIKETVSGDLSEAIVNFINAEDEYNQQLDSNATAIANNTASLQDELLVRDKLLKKAQDNVYAAKEEREAQVEMTKLMNEAEKQFQDLDAAYAKNTKKKKENTESGNNNNKTSKASANARKQALEAIKNENLERQLGFDLIKGLTQEESKAQAQKKELWKAQDEHNQALEDAIKTRNDALESIKLENLERQIGFKLIKGLTKEESKAEAIKKKLWKAQEKYNKSLEEADDYLTDLIKLNKQNIELQKSGLNITLEQYNRYLLLNKSKKELYLTEIKRSESIKKAQEQNKKYNEDLKASNKQIEYQTILVDKNTDAARLWQLQQEYGSKANAKQIFENEKILEQLDLKKGLYDQLTTAVSDFINGTIDSWSDFRKEISKPIQAQLNQVINKTINGESGGIGSGGVSSLFKNVGSIFTKGISGITQAIGGIKTIFSGGGLLSGAGSLLGGLGAALPAIGIITSVFSVLKDIFGGKPRVTIGQEEFAEGVGDAVNERWNGAGFHKGGAYTRESSFGEFGIIGGGRTKRIGGDLYEALDGVLDVMQQIDNAAFDISTDSARVDIRRELVQNNQREDGDKIDPTKLIGERLDIILRAADDYLVELVGTGSFEEQTQRLLELQAVSNTVIPSLKELGFNIGDVASVSLPATVSLLELAGGLENLGSLRSNYLDKVLTEEEKLANVRKSQQEVIDSLNDQLGLTDKATISSTSGLKMYVQALETSGELTTKQGQENLIAAYASADAFAYMEQQQQELTQQQLELANAEKIRNEQLYSLGIRAGEGVDIFSASMDGIIEKTSSYSDFVFSAQEKLTIAQGNAAMSIKNVTEQYGLAANDLDTAAELRAQVDAANAAGDYEKVAALLQVTESVKVLSDAGVSSQDALSGVNEELRNVIGGVQDVVEPFTSINVILEDVVENQLPSAAVTIQEIAEDINSIDYSNNKVIDLQAYNRDKEQQELAAMKDQLTSLNQTSAQSKNATEALTGLTSATLETLRRIDAKTADGNS